MSDIANFNTTLVTNHKNPDLPVHKLLFLLEVGLCIDVPQIDEAIKQILYTKDENGIPKSMTNVPKRFGGSGENTLAWALCDEVFTELGKFRGPGRKEDCCPYATLIILKLLTKIPEYQKSELANSIINVLLNLWERSQEQHPYMFYMGTDFRKLKAPSLWYDIVSMADSLSYFESARKDKRFH